MVQILKTHSFSLALIGAVVLGLLFPEPAAPGGWLFPDITTKLGVALIFLFQGLSLPTRELAGGYRKKRLHVFILGWNFLFFPVVVGLLLLPSKAWIDADFRLGFWLLGILPTTVSSAVAFTALAGGRSANAIFATVASNLLAVLLVPAVAVFYFAAGNGGSIPLGPLLGKLALLIVLPLLVGQAVRALAPAQAAAIGKRGKCLSSGIIVFIVHAAFARSVTAGQMEHFAASELLVALLGTAILFAAVSASVWWTAAALRFDPPERITAFFCASQKSIATGLPMATMIFAAAPASIDSAAALIPLMCYHPLQLFLGSFLVGRWGSRRPDGA